MRALRAEFREPVLTPHVNRLPLLPSSGLRKQIELSRSDGLIGHAAAGRAQSLSLRPRGLCVCSQIRHRPRRNEKSA